MTKSNLINFHRKFKLFTKFISCWHLTLLLLLGISCRTWANLDLITWKGIYYDAHPIKKDISLEYCKEHTIGSFIHTIKDSHIITDKNIVLTDSHFNIDKVNKIYLIYGDFLAINKSAQSRWQDRIYYFLYKTKENGITKGIWYTDKCKGLYTGFPIKNVNK